METTVRKGQTVYAADGTYLGGVLQCDSRFIVVGRNRWASDHVVIPVEEVAAAGSNLLILRALPETVRPETAEPWTPPPDPQGNANGVDLEPLRAGMAEIEDRSAGIATVPAGGAARAAEAQASALFPSPEDERGLERARIAKVDSEIDRYIGEELEDFEIGSGCAYPAPEETARAAAELPAAEAPRQAPSGEAAAARGAASPVLAATRAATRATRSKRAFERILHRSGFSRAEAKAIAAGGFLGLLSLVESSVSPR